MIILKVAVAVWSGAFPEICLGGGEGNETDRTSIRKVDETLGIRNMNLLNTDIELLLATLLGVVVDDNGNDDHVLRHL